MKVPDLSARMACGGFYWTFLSYMSQRSKKSKEKAAQKHSLHVHWPVSSVRTTMLTTLFIVVAVCDSTDYNSLTVSPCVDSLRRSWLELAVILSMKRNATQSSKEHARYKLCISPQQASMLTLPLLTMSAFVFIAGYLLSCGDVEANPGPARSGEERNTYLRYLANHNNYPAVSGGADPYPWVVPASVPASTPSYYGGVQQHNLHQHSAVEGGPLDLATMQRLFDTQERKFQSLNSELMTKMDSSFSDVRKQIQSIQSKADDLEQNYFSMLQETRATHAAVTTLEERLNQTAAELDDKIDKLEAFSRRDNLKFFNIAQSADEDYYTCVTKVLDVLRDTVPEKHWDRTDIVRAHRLGNKKHDSNPARPQPMIARFARWSDKLEVLTTGREALRRKNITVAADLTTRQQNIIQEHRDRGLKAYYRGNKLVVDGPLQQRHYNRSSSFGRGRRNLHEQQHSSRNDYNRDSEGGQQWRQTTGQRSHSRSRRDSYNRHNTAEDYNPKNTNQAWYDRRSYQESDEHTNRYDTDAVPTQYSTEQRYQSGMFGDSHSHQYNADPYNTNDWNHDWYDRSSYQDWDAYLHRQEPEAWRIPQSAPNSKTYSAASRENTRYPETGKADLRTTAPRDYQMEDETTARKTYSSPDEDSQPGNAPATSKGTDNTHQAAAQQQETKVNPDDASTHSLEMPAGGGPTEEVNGDTVEAGDPSGSAALVETSGDESDDVQEGNLRALELSIQGATDTTAQATEVSPATQHNAEENDVIAEVPDKRPLTRARAQTVREGMDKRQMTLADCGVHSTTPVPTVTNRVTDEGEGAR